MKIEKDVTILLPIFNRLNYTKKWLDFAEIQKNPFHIYICDGGNIKNADKLLELKKRNLKITYKKFKYYKNYKNIFEKYHLVLKNIKSSYVFLSEDDDYLIINSIKNSLKFLKKNKSFSCVKGINCLGEIIQSKNKVISLVLRNEKNNQIDFSLDSSSSDDRLIDFFDKKNVTLWNGLHTRKSLVNTFKILGKRDFFNLYITELIFCLKVVFEGKIKRINQIDYIKMDNTDLSSSNNFVKMRPFSKIVKSKFFKEENKLIFNYLKFKNKNKKIRFKKMYYNFLNKDKKLRIFFEKKQNSLKKIYIDKIKNILIFLNIFFVFKFFKNYFKSVYCNKKIMLLNQNLKNSFKKEKNSYYQIINFNN